MLLTLTPMRYSLLIFDLEGTLVDSRSSILAAMENMALEMGMTQEVFFRRKVHIGLPMADILKSLGICDIPAARAVYKKIQSSPEPCTLYPAPPYHYPFSANLKMQWRSPVHPFCSWAKAMSSPN